MECPECRDNIPAARGVGSREIPGADYREGLVYRNPVGNSIAEALHHYPGKLHKVPDDPAVYPPAFRLEAFGEIPVIEGDHGVYAPVQEPVDEAVVEIQSLRIHPATPLGKHPGPAYGKAIGSAPDSLDEIEVLPPTVVVVAGHIPVAPVPDRPGAPGKSVPNRDPFPVILPGALDLIRGGTDPPEEVVGEGDGSHESKLR